jgi:hypothetical protein
MTLAFAFSASSHLLVALGLAALAFTGELFAIYLLAAAASLACSILGEVRPSRGFLPAPLTNAAIVMIFAFVLASIFLFKALPIQELGHFLLALQAVKLLSVKKERDWLQLYLLSFFSLIAAAALSVEIPIAVTFACYLVWGPWVLVLFHLYRARDRAGDRLGPKDPWPLWPLFRVVAAMSVLLFVLTLAFFVILPRFSSGYLGEVWAGGATTGFSDRLALGEIASIKRNNATAMRVKVDRPDLLSRPSLYWRGVALDRFDGRRWERSKPGAAFLRSMRGAFVLDEPGSGGGPVIHQEILLEPIGSSALIFLGRPLSVTGGVRGLLKDRLGNLRTPFPPPFQISYDVVSALDGPPADDLPREDFLQLPDLDPRIALLARRLTDGVDGELDKARAVEAYLKANYRYTLQNLPVGSDDPLAQFLFQAGQGDCEYFSSALAIMLRQIGIPARVVNGYLGGEWNAYGDYYLVQQSHAHSWVEAYFSGRGWLTLDATPPGAAERPLSHFASLADFVDYLRLRWYRYVINFGLQDQYFLLAGLKSPHSWLRPALPGFSAAGSIRETLSDPKNWILPGFLLVSLGAAGFFLRRKRRTAAPLRHEVHREATRRYRRFLDLAKKRGIRKSPGQTPDEFCTAARKLGQKSVADLTALYQRARFSRTADDADLREMDRILTDLRR